MQIIGRTALAALAASGAMGLERIRRRGRWSQMKSVQRYSKSHRIREARAACPPASLALGLQIMKSPAGKMSEAMRASPAERV